MNSHDFLPERWCGVHSLSTVSGRWFSIARGSARYERFLVGTWSHIRTRKITSRFVIYVLVLAKNHLFSSLCPGNAAKCIVCSCQDMMLRRCVRAWLVGWVRVSVCVCVCACVLWHLLDVFTLKKSLCSPSLLRQCSRSLWVIWLFRATAQKGPGTMPTKHSTTFKSARKLSAHFKFSNRLFSFRGAGRVSWVSCPKKSSTIMMTKSVCWDQSHDLS